MHAYDANPCPVAKLYIMKRLAAQAKITGTERGGRKEPEPMCFPPD